MARKARKTQDESKDDDAPEVVSHLASKANAKRHQKALYDFEAEENARRKARNRERDQKLKERARVTRGGRAGGEAKGVRFVNLRVEGEGEQGSDDDEGNDSDGDVEARMLRAMRDAENEVGSSEGEDDDDDDDDDSDGESSGLGQDMDVGGKMMSGSNASFEEDEDESDAVMPLGENDSIDPEALTDDEEMDEDDVEGDETPLQSNTQISTRKASYLADDLFTAAFAPQDLKPSSKKNTESVRQQPTKQRRRKAVTRAKDLVIGGRTIRTLPRPSDPRSQATSRSVPSARARKFLDQNLCMMGSKAILKAKKKGWERRPANVGVMKYQGAPHGFVRSTR